MTDERATGAPREWPKLFGEFRVSEQLGVGPFATTLKVRMIGDPERRGDMAMKVFHQVALSAWKVVRRIDLTPTNALLDNPHPSLARTWEYGHLIDDVYVLQDLADGVDLRTLLTLYPDTETGFGLRERLGVAVQLAGALEHLHTIRLPEDRKARLVHGDIYPGNIIVGRDGIVRVTDLGFAAAAREVCRPAMDGPVMGSLGYVAPEQFAGRRATPSTDVFAFGALLAELLLGEPLFYSEYAEDVIDRSRAADIAPFLPRIEGAHPGAARIVSRSVTPERRGRVADGVLLMAEMFAAGLTDPAEEKLAAVVEGALEAGPVPLEPRPLYAANGTRVDVYVAAPGADRTIYDGDDSLDEPSFESNTYEQYPDELSYSPSADYPTATDTSDGPEPDEPSEASESTADVAPPVPPPVAEDAAASGPVDPALDGSSIEIEALDEPAPPKALARVASGELPQAARTPPPKKKSKALPIIAALGAVVALLACAGLLSTGTLGALFLSSDSGDPDPGDFHVIPDPIEPVTAVPVDAPADEDADGLADLEGEEGEEGNEDEEGEEDAGSDEEIDEEPTPEPEPLSPEELERQRELEEQRRAEREERDRERREREAADAREAAARDREAELADADLDIDWGDVETDEDEDWLSGDSSGSGGEDEIDIDIDSLSRSAPDVALPSSEPPKVRHTQIRSGRVGSSVTLKVTVTPSDTYSGTLYYRPMPSGSWMTQDISGGENGRITAKLHLGSWIDDDHLTVEYYWLVDGPTGSGGAGTRLNPYGFELK